MLFCCFFDKDARPRSARTEDPASNRATDTDATVLPDTQEHTARQVGLVGDADNDYADDGTSQIREHPSLSTNLCETHSTF